MNTAAWVLILFAHVGPMGSGNSNALAMHGGFATRQLCEQAGTAATRLASNSVKQIAFACVPTAEGQR